MLRLSLLRRALAVAAAVALMLVSLSELSAQAPADGAGPSTGARKPRRLAPGVLTTIPSTPTEEETFTGPRQLTEILQGIDKSVLDWGGTPPNFSPVTETLGDMAKEVTFRRQIWNLEFTFKPLRMINVDIPQPTGKYEKKLVWYMVYKVTNHGKHMTPTAEVDPLGNKTYKVLPTDFPVRFFPRVNLVTHDLVSAGEGAEMVVENKNFPDRLMPTAIPAIQRREDPAIPLRNAVEISQLNIPVSDERNDQSVWGVFTWTDIDPEADFFSIYIQGLTNAFKWEDAPGGYKPGDPPGSGRIYQYKTLRLLYWRPGDGVQESESEIRYGVPFFAEEAQQARVLQIYGLDKRVDYLWLYR